MEREKVFLDMTSSMNDINEEELRFDKALLDIKDIERKKSYEIFKRIIDFFSPVLVWIAYRIHKDEPSCSVIFSQKRVGRNGKPFTMYKFRSMCVDAEEQLTELLDKNEIKGAMFKIKEDPRITEFGKFIRRTSLDELPQLINVIKGDMSLIGPRPPLQREVAEYTQYDMQRLLVKPGCSCVWQVSGRNDVHFDEMVVFDIEYIKTRSTRNDLSLIIKTIKVMLKSSGAY